MKPKLAHKLFGALLLAGFLSSAWDGQAAPSQQHPERGVIQTVDRAADSFTLISEKDAAQRTFIWKNHTSFRQKSPQADASWISRAFTLGEKTTAESLQPGRTVRFYYRKEFGRFVVRGVTVLLPAINSSMLKGSTHD